MTKQKKTTVEKPDAAKRPREQQVSAGLPLPNGINLRKLKSLLMYSNRYEITIQFWPDQTAVYIAKEGVDFQDFGGDFDFAITKSLEYLDRINRQKD